MRVQSSYVSRDAAGALLAHIDGDDDLLGEIAARHGLAGESLTFVVALLGLAVYGREDLEGFGNKVFDEVALSWASR